MGFDNPRNLGDRETGGGLSLPIWIDYMKVALKGVPLAKAPNPPEGVTRQGDWVYTEYAGGRGIARIGVASNYSAAPAARRNGGSPSGGSDSAPPPADNVGAHSTDPFGGN